MIRELLARFWKRKPAPETPYPFALTPAQITHLQEFRASAGYATFQHVLTEIAQTRLSRLLSTDPTKVEFERGALASLHDITNVVDVILTKCEEINARTDKRNGAGNTSNPNARFWGHPAFFGGSTPKS